MDIRDLKKVVPVNLYAEQKRWDYLHSLEERGWRLVNTEVVNFWLDVESNIPTFDRVIIRDWRTQQTVARMTPQEFAETNYERERWQDVDYDYDPFW